MDCFVAYASRNDGFRLAFPSACSIPKKRALPCQMATLQYCPVPISTSPDTEIGYRPIRSGWSIWSANQASFAAIDSIKDTS
jgi:hypothetical protein